ALVSGVSEGAATIVDVSQTAPLQLASLVLTPVTPAARAEGDVCSTFSPTAVTATAITSLPDGSRAYASSFASFAVNVSISGATVNTANGTTAYTYAPPASRPDLLAGMVVTIAGATPSDFDGTFTILSVGGGTFQVTNSPTDQYVSGGSAISANVC